MRRRSLLAAAGLVAIVGCGGGRGAVTPQRAQRCLQGAGYAAARAPGSEVLHTTGEVDVTRGSLRAAIYFFDSVDAASQDAVSLGHTLATTGHGLAVQRGSVVIGYARRPARGDRDRLERCL